MASTALSLYCFEVLAASLNKQDALSLKEVEDLWTTYKSSSRLTRDKDGGVDVNDEDLTEEDDGESGDENEEEAKGDTRAVPLSLQNRNVTRLQGSSSASVSSTSTPSTLSTTSSQSGLGDASKSSSKSSFFSFGRKSEQSLPLEKEEEHPLFVTWNIINSRGHKSLRGCIGTFEAQPLSEGLKSFALTSCVIRATYLYGYADRKSSAFEDVRFSPIHRSELPSLSNDITLLMNFTPCAGPLDWELGTHGIRISFTYHGRRYGATYLPDVAVEQEWTKEETIVSLMRKAGWSGRSSEWTKVIDLKCIRYEGKKASVGYQTWKDFHAWAEGP